jgi:hypothetical protein
VGAEEHGIDATADLGRRLHHLLVDGVQRIHVEQPATDSRLIGGDHHPVTPLIEFGDGLEAAAYRFPLIRRFDELGGILVDDAVAIEDDELHDAQGRGARGEGRGKLLTIMLPILKYQRPGS